MGVDRHLEGASNSIATKETWMDVNKWKCGELQNHLEGDMHAQCVVASRMLCK
jgi:hypothetical protein